MRKNEECLRGTSLLVRHYLYIWLMVILYDDTITTPPTNPTNANPINQNQSMYYRVIRHATYVSVTIMPFLDNTQKSSGIHCELFVQHAVILGLLDVVYRCGI